MIIRNRTTKTGITKTLKASSLNNRWYADRRTSGQVGKDVNDPVRVAPRWCHGYPFRVHSPSAPLSAGRPDLRLLSGDAVSVMRLQQ
jgi:hypothetical protein